VPRAKFGSFYWQSLPVEDICQPTTAFIRGVWRLSAKCEPNYTHRPLSPFGRLKDARRRDGEHGNSLRAVQWGQGRTQTADIAGRLNQFKPNVSRLFSLFSQPDEGLI
jgi:hypothetical protein